ncbi:MAG: TIGR02757 family protein [Deltaproteobacteria bacterium RBG_13_65_10]|jgi:uncharacterized protein (TIGR02757 family)|nr:MAG: TIGR02757 family protein [Deltaproteobacteria bacterium RBG_13_65_10]
MIASAPAPARRAARSAPRRTVDWPLLKERLDALVRTFDRRFLSPDPLERVLAFGNADDREIGGLFAASLAYGNAKAILASLDDLFARMGGRPAAFVRGFCRARDARVLASFRHRWTAGKDVAHLCAILSAALAEHGSLGKLFARFAASGEPTVREPLIRFVHALLAYAPGLPRDAGVRHLLSSPEDGSACKRMNLYLRWMVRGGDGIDCGLWRDIPASALVIPLDTHVARISGFLGLTRRRTRDWKMAEEITAGLRRLDPTDPVKYDFAICRLGILDHCPRRRNLSKCAACPLLALCTA